MPTLQNIIALLYDCDLTLTSCYMQQPLFRKYNVDEEEFWQETQRSREEAKEKGINLDQEISYMNLILDKFPGLSNQELKELGGEIPLFPGLPDFFGKTRQMMAEDEKYKLHNITIEHYVISTGLKAMIEGCLGSYLDGIFASEFIENKEGKICGIARSIGYAKKTEFIHLINKGGNVDPRIDVNGVLSPEFRRIPFENMVYIGDGVTDVPCFATLNRRGGKSFAVYDASSEKAFRQAYLLREQGRVFDFGPADYREDSHMFKSLLHTIRQRAGQIVENREKQVNPHLMRGPVL